MAQHPAQGFVVAAQDRVEAVFAEPVHPAMLTLGFMGAEQARAHHGGGGEGNSQGDDNGGRKRDGELPEEPAYDSAHQQDRQEHGDQRDADGEHGEADLGRALERGGHGLHAFLEIAGDIFDDHNRVVDHEPGGDGQRHQRKVVDGVAEQIEHAECAHQRDGDGHAGYQGGWHAAQEQKNHHNHQANGDAQRDFHVIDGASDGERAIQDDAHVNGGGNFRLQLRKRGANPVHRVDDICPRHAEDDQQDGLLAVGEADGADVLHGIDDIGDIAKHHRRVVAIGDHQGFILIGETNLIRGGDGPGTAVVVELSLREIDVCRAEHGAHVLKAEAEMIEPGGIDVHADRGQGASTHENLSHAFHLRQFLLQDGGGGVVDVAGRDGVRGQGEHQNRRVGRIDLAPVGILRQRGGQLAAGGVDGRLHVAGGGVDVAAQVELHGNAATAERARRSHFVQAGDAAELPFERRGDRGGHGFRARAGQPGGDLKGGEFYLGQRRDGQEKIGDAAGQAKRQCEQRSGDRAMNEWRGDAHARSGWGSSPGRTVTPAPLRPVTRRAARSKNK